MHHRHPGHDRVRAVVQPIRERELILARTSEGRTRAKARGVKMGRGFALTPEQRRQALARLDAGEASREIARTFNVAHTTIGRLARAA